MNQPSTLRRAAFATLATLVTLAVVGGQLLLATHYAPQGAAPAPLHAVALQARAA